MNTSIPAVLQTPALSRSDQAELLDHLDADAVRFEQVTAGAGHLGEPATAVAIVSLSMVAITGICAWLAAKGKGVSLSMSVKAPGVQASVDLILNGDRQPEAVKAELEAKGVQVQ